MSGDCVVCVAMPNGQPPLTTLGHSTAEHAGLVDLVNGLDGRCKDCGLSMAKVIRIERCCASAKATEMITYREGRLYPVEWSAGG